MRRRPEVTRRMSHLPHLSENVYVWVVAIASLSLYFRAARYD